MTNVYTGANGTLLFSSDTKTPEGAHADAIINQSSYDLFDVGRVTGVEVHVNTDLQGYYEVGRRFPVSLHPENIHISGKINRAYVNGALLFLLLGKGANPTQSPEPFPEPVLTMQLLLQDQAVPGTRCVLSLDGVKFENWAFSIPENDFVMENVTFKALNIRVQDEEGASDTSRNVKKPKFPDKTN
jgi:hypothetical protein